MRRTLIIFALGALLPSLAIAQRSGRRSAPSVNDEQAVQQTDREVIEARRRARQGEPSTLERMLVQDFIATSLNGRVVNKAQYLRVNTNPGVRFSGLETDDLKVRVYGNAAVVTGRVKLTSQREGNVFQFRYMRMYVKNGGRWQLASSHLTAVTQ